MDPHVIVIMVVAVISLNEQMKKLVIRFNAIKGLAGRHVSANGRPLLWGPLEGVKRFRS